RPRDAERARRRADEPRRCAAGGDRRHLRRDPLLAARHAPVVGPDRLADRGLAQFAAWANREHGVPLTAPSLWPAYGKDPRVPGRVPASYGDSPARMTGKTWDRF